MSCIGSISKQFAYYKQIAEKTFDQLTEEQLFWKYNEESNSIANIVHHLNGNMLSRWTDFLTSDGEKIGRNRDSEFEETLKTKTEMLAFWDKGWDCLFAALDSISDEDLSKLIYIRNQEQTLMEALHRQLAHYPYHIGQIVFLGKMMCNEDWKSLSIPKGKSVEFNAEKFSLDKE